MSATRTAAGDPPRAAPRRYAGYDGPLQPGLIPATRPLRYISRMTALNLRIDGELTGDWHVHTALFTPAGENPVFLPCAGEGERPDTTPSLGDRGVRDVSGVLSSLYGQEIPGPVWAADHFRAIADIVMNDQMRLARIADRARPLSLRRQATVRTINSWLDTEDEVDELVHGFLVPLRSQMCGVADTLYDEWLPTVEWE